MGEQRYMRPQLPTIGNQGQPPQPQGQPSPFSWANALQANQGANQQPNMPAANSLPFMQRLQSMFHPQQSTSPAATPNGQGFWSGQQGYPQMLARALMQNGGGSNGPTY